MKAFIILLVLIVGGILGVDLYGQHKDIREAEYVSQINTIVEQNQQRLNAYILLAQKFVWNDSFLATYTSIDGFKRVRIEESRALAERIVLLRGIVESVGPGIDYRWKDSVRQRAFSKAYNRNEKLVLIADELRRSAEHLLRVLSEQPVG